MSTITAINVTSISGIPIVSIGSVTDGFCIEVSVTAAVTVNDTYSFELRNTRSNSVFYSSKEGANSLELVIQ